MEDLGRYHGFLSHGVGEVRSVKETSRVIQVSKPTTLAFTFLDRLLTAPVKSIAQKSNKLHVTTHAYRRGGTAATNHAVSIFEAPALPKLAKKVIRLKKAFNTTPCKRLRHELRYDTTQRILVDMLSDQ